MKKMMDIIVGLALMLTFFSTIAVSEDSHIFLYGEKSENYTAPSEVTFEIEVEKDTIQRKISANAVSSASVTVYIESECSKCGVALKVTDPNGRVILDKSTTETGFIMKSDRAENFLFKNPVEGKYKVWFNVVNHKEDLKLRCVISGYPKQ